MTKRFVKEGHIFDIANTKAGKVRLSYEGKEGDFQQGCIWICKDEAEVMDMIEAVIDPGRYPDDEFHARHHEAFDKSLAAFEEKERQRKVRMAARRKEIV